MEFGLLGPFEVHIAGTALNLGGRQRRTLLAILAVHSCEAVSTDRLIGELCMGRVGSGRGTQQRSKPTVAHLRRILNVDGEVLLPADRLQAEMLRVRTADNPVCCNLGKRR